MTTLESLVLGLISGLEGILPVSGEGLSIWAWRKLLGHSGALPQETLDLFKIGMVLAILWSLRGELRDAVLRRPAWWGWLVLAAVPAAVFGPKVRLMRDTAQLLPWGFLATGAFLAWVAWDGRPSADGTAGTPREEPTATDALLVGLSQVAAFCPGISRLGMAWGAGRICGLASRVSLRYGLLLAAPILAIHLLFDALWTRPAIAAPQAAVGIAGAFLSALTCLSLLREWMERAGAGPFAPLSFLLAGLAFLI